MEEFFLNTHTQQLYLSLSWKKWGEIECFSKAPASLRLRSILPTSLNCIVLLTRRCTPWRSEVAKVPLPTTYHLDSNCHSLTPHVNQRYGEWWLFYFYQKSDNKKLLSLCAHILFFLHQASISTLQLHLRFTIRKILQIIIMWCHFYQPFHPYCWTTSHKISCGQYEVLKHDPWRFVVQHWRGVDSDDLIVFDREIMTWIVLFVHEQNADNG